METCSFLKGTLCFLQNIYQLALREHTILSRIRIFFFMYFYSCAYTLILKCNHFFPSTFMQGLGFLNIARFNYYRDSWTFQVMFIIISRTFFVVCLYANDWMVGTGLSQSDWYSGWYVVVFHWSVYALFFWFFRPFSIIFGTSSCLLLYWQWPGNGSNKK